MDNSPEIRGWLQNMEYGMEYKMDHGCEVLAFKQQTKLEGGFTTRQMGDVKQQLNAYSVLHLQKSYFTI